MARALVVYESMFGNTRQIAEAIAAGLSGTMIAEAVEVGAAPADPVADILIVGGPTHAWSMSRSMTRKGAGDQSGGVPLVSKGIGIRDWIKALPRSSQPAATFCTAIRQKGWFPSGSAAKAAANALTVKGRRIVEPSEDFFVGGTNGPLEDGELARATEWGRTIAMRITGHAGGRAA